MTNFNQLFSAIDTLIMAALGDDITLIPPVGLAVNTQCVLSARPNSGAKDIYSWTDNIWAKIDIYSVVVEMPENEAPAIAKGWNADYEGQIYAITEVFRKGDGTIAVVLNQPGNTIATIGGWK